jgi:hypothetical protein
MEGVEEVLFIFSSSINDYVWSLSNSLIRLHAYRLKDTMMSKQPHTLQ